MKTGEVRWIGRRVPHTHFVAAEFHQTQLIVLISLTASLLRVWREGGRGEGGEGTKEERKAGRGEVREGGRTEGGGEGVYDTP